MLQEFCHYITEKALFYPKQKVLLAVSGGIDSAVMCHLFHKAKFSFAIAHCNFQLRGKESDADEAFVQQLARLYDVPFFVRHFSTEEYARDKKISIQMAARDLRYQWFQEICKKEQYDLIATAHHQNDSLETILLNLTRGTGIEGLHGIKSATGNIIRPLLFASREQIRQYIQDENLSWREDSSNQSTKYYRNLIRHEVIPVLKKINPNLEETIEQSVEKIQAAENIFKAKVEEVKKKILHHNTEFIAINIQLLQGEIEPVMILSELLKPYGFSFKDVHNLFQTSETGKRIESPTHTAVRDREQFIITEETGETGETYTIDQAEKTLIAGSFRLFFSIEKNQEFKIPASQDIACLDADKLQFPLLIRKWEEGDFFYPLGMRQKKKISDLLIDLKVPLNLKNKVKVVVSGENIVWVIGFRIDERYRIGNDTEKIFRIMKENL